MALTQLQGGVVKQERDHHPAIIGKEGHPVDERLTDGDPPLVEKDVQPFQTESLADAQSASRDQQRKLILWLLEFAEHFESVFDPKS